MHEHLKNNYFLTPNYSKNDLFESSEYVLLCANSCGIFEIEWDRTIRQFSKFTAIGSGEKYALGAVKALYNIYDDPSEIVQASLVIAAKYDKRTHAPFHFSTISSL